MKKYICSPSFVTLYTAAPDSICSWAAVNPLNSHEKIWREIIASVCSHQDDYLFYFDSSSDLVIYNLKNMSFMTLNAFTDTLN